MSAASWARKWRISGPPCCAEGAGNDAAGSAGGCGREAARSKREEEARAQRQPRMQWRAGGRVSTLGLELALHNGRGEGVHEGVHEPGEGRRK